jgi:hypothetical protein
VIDQLALRSEGQPRGKCGNVQRHTPQTDTTSGVLNGSLV